jgi:hypothetical protein
MTMAKSIYYTDEIAEERTVCAYCGADYDEGDYRGCCGEVHCETLYIFEDGAELLESEVRLIKGHRPLSEQELEDVNQELAYEKGAGK